MLFKITVTLKPLNQLQISFYAKKYKSAIYKIQCSQRHFYLKFLLVISTVCSTYGLSYTNLPIITLSLTKYRLCKNVKHLFPKYIMYVGDGKQRPVRTIITTWALLNRFQ